MIYRPPKWLDRILEWYCNPDLLEDLQGDLHELYHSKAERAGSKSANLKYAWLVIRSFRLSTIKRASYQKSNVFTMTKTNFKIAARILYQDKFNSFLNIAGLAIGVACFLLLGFYVQKEFSFDQFHSRKDRIYRAWVKEVYSEDKIFFNAVTPLVFEPVFENNFAEIERCVRFDKISLAIGEGEDVENDQVAVISPDFFQVFDFTIIDGQPTNPIPTKNDILISTSYAKKYFGELNPMGRTLILNVREEPREFRVTAVMSDIRETSGIHFDLAISTANTIDIYGEDAMDAWFNVSVETYVLIKENASLSSVEAALPEVIKANMDEELADGVYNIGFQPLTDIHLNGDIPTGLAPVGNKQYVLTLAVISILVVVIACVNYTTLSIGQSLRRTREVGVRKAMGAMRASLIGQYISESILISILSVALGIILAVFLLPSFNSLTGADITMSFEPWHIGLYISLVLLIGVVSGAYPALILSGKKAVAALSGSGNINKQHTIRKGMVVGQFVVAIFLISSTLVMRQQLEYMQTKDLGYNYDTVVSVPLPADPSSRRLTEYISSAMTNGEKLREKLSNYPEIQSTGMGSHVFGTAGWGNLSFTDKFDNFRQFTMLVVDPFYMKTFDISINLGRSFDPDSEADKRNAIVLNQAAAQYFGLEDPIGKSLPSDDFTEHVIIGVTDDFNYSSLHNDVEPLIITQNAGILLPGISDFGFGDSPIPKMVFRYQGGQLLRVREILEKEWSILFPDEQLEFSFVDEDVKYQYAEEEKLNRLISISTILAILIAVLGLLGLTVLVTNSKTKEIGIRKVIGASELSIFSMLAKGFGLQLIIATFIAIPISYLYMRQWLTNFSFQIKMGPLVFILSGSIVLAIALIVISYHTLRASKINPVESLRSE